MTHECIIGVLYNYEDTDIVTASGLKMHIDWQEKRQEKLCEFYRNVGLSKPRVWSLRDYADRRKTTNLNRFSYCPECGKAIDWKAIRKEGTK